MRSITHIPNHAASVTLVRGHFSFLDVGGDGDGNGSGGGGGGGACISILTCICMESRD